MGNTMHSNNIGHASASQSSLAQMQSQSIRTSNKKEVMNTTMVSHATQNGQHSGYTNTPQQGYVTQQPQQYYNGPPPLKQGFGVGMQHQQQYHHTSSSQSQQQTQHYGS